MKPTTGMIPLVTEGAYSRREKQAEKEYERCKAEYDREKAKTEQTL